MTTPHTTKLLRLIGAVGPTVAQIGYLDPEGVHHWFPVSAGVYDVTFTPPPDAIALVARNHDGTTVWRQVIN